MDSVRNRIFNGLKENGISEQDCDQVYKTIEGFANYGFPESHAASFALLTYASAYLHIHHPDVFTCALLNSQPMGFYSPRSLIADAQRHHVTVLPLDVQKSNYDYTLEVGPETKSDQTTQRSQGQRLYDLRLGFRSIRGINESHLRRIENLRQEAGLFLDLADFAKRTHLPRPTLLRLAAAGAFHSFENPSQKGARKILWEIESLSLDQDSFLWGLPRERFVSATYQEEDLTESLPFESQWEEMQREYEHQGFSIHLHPLSILRSTLNEKNLFFRQKNQVPFVDGEQLKELESGHVLRIAGLVGLTQRPPTAKGMCFITLEDEFGFINVVIPPDVYQKDRLSIYGHSLLEIWGRLEKRNGVINVKAQRVFPLLLNPQTDTQAHQKDKTCDPH